MFAGDLHPVASILSSLRSGISKTALVWVLEVLDLVPYVFDGEYLSLVLTPLVDKKLN